MENPKSQERQVCSFHGIRDSKTSISEKKRSKKPRKTQRIDVIQKKSLNLGLSKNYNLIQNEVQTQNSSIAAVITNIQ